jgi:hypothetical protein
MLTRGAFEGCGFYTTEFLNSRKYDTGFEGVRIAGSTSGPTLTFLARVRREDVSRSLPTAWLSRVDGSRMPLEVNYAGDDGLYLAASIPYTRPLGAKSAELHVQVPNSPESIFRLTLPPIPPRRKEAQANAPTKHIPGIELKGVAWSEPARSDSEKPLLARVLWVDASQAGSEHVRLTKSEWRVAGWGDSWQSRLFFADTGMASALKGTAEEQDWLVEPKAVEYRLTFEIGKVYPEPVDFGLVAIKPIRTFADASKNPMTLAKPVSVRTRYGLELTLLPVTHVAAYASHNLEVIHRTLYFQLEIRQGLKTGLPDLPEGSLVRFETLTSPGLNQMYYRPTFDDASQAMLSTVFPSVPKGDRVPLALDVRRVAFREVTTGITVPVKNGMTSSLRSKIPAQSGQPAHLGLHQILSFDPNVVKPSLMAKR